MTLEQKQKAERKRLELLSNSIQNNVSSLDELLDVLKKYRGFYKDDPVQHIKNAMSNYVKSDT